MDDYIFELLGNLRDPFLDSAMLWITQFSTIFIVMFLMPSLLYLELKHSRKYLIPLWFTLLASNFFSYIFKIFFARRRPFGTEGFFGAWDSSFPSGHTTIVFAAAVVLQKIFPRLGWFWYSFATLVALSRVYINIHYLSDVAAGALLGYLVGLGTLYLANKKKLIKSFKKHPKLEALHFSWKGAYLIEFRRKILHMAVGIGIVTLIHFKIIESFELFLTLCFGIVLSFLCKHYKVPVIEWFLDKFERKHTYPGKGAITFFVGSILALQLFPKEIALAAILILALGDGISTLIGPLGKRKTFLSEEKLMEGTLAGIILGTLGAMAFVPLQEAFLGATLAMSLEATEIKLNNKVLSDNILVPLVAGTTMLLLRMFLA